MSNLILIPWRKHKLKLKEDNIIKLYLSHNDIFKKHNSEGNLLHYHKTKA